MGKKRSAKKTRFRPGATGECEAQLWRFTGSSRTIYDDEASRLHWVAAESLEARKRRRYAIRNCCQFSGEPETSPAPGGAGLNNL
jgi:hypothetical protein